MLLVYGLNNKRYFSRRFTDAYIMELRVNIQ